MSEYVCPMGHLTTYIELRREAEQDTVLCDLCSQAAVLTQSLESVMRRIKPDVFIVTYSKGLYQGHEPREIEFFDEYPDALHHAIQAVRGGRREVTVLQNREVLHQHSDLSLAELSLDRYFSPQEAVEEVHHASRTQDSRQLTALLRSAPKRGAIVWASL